MAMITDLPTVIFGEFPRTENSSLFADIKKMIQNIGALRGQCLTSACQLGGSGRRFFMLPIWRLDLVIHQRKSRSL